jgi:death-on-curing protein
MGLLQSALAMPQAGIRDQYFHSDLFEMASAYLFYIVKNHPFVDGNKRVGAVAMLVFLEINGIEVRLTNNELYRVLTDVAEGRLKKSGVAEILRKRTVA